MFVKFANTNVHIYKLKKGVLVEYAGDFYHIKHVHRTQDQRIVLVLENEFEDVEVQPVFVDWLEA